MLGLHFLCHRNSVGLVLVVMVVRGVNKTKGTPVNSHVWLGEPGFQYEIQSMNVPINQIGSFANFTALQTNLFSKVASAS